jgi:hypothetical protein
MQNKWIKVYSNPQLYMVEIVKSVLHDNGIETVILNKQDSAYIPIGEVELYAPPQNADIAQNIISINNL